MKGPSLEVTSCIEQVASEFEQRDLHAKIQLGACGLWLVAGSLWRVACGVWLVVEESCEWIAIADLVRI